jgi:predicted DNA-binding protein (MmcQ/YjbR family)
MDIEELREYCISKGGVTEEFPFDETTLVFKVMGKIFMLMPLEGELTVNLKCDPVRAAELRESYPAVQPGYHMSKKHWNTVYFDGSINRGLLLELIDHSYNLVVAGLTKRVREQLESDK